MKLFAPREHGCNERYPYAAADIAGQINQAGGGIVFLWRKIGVSHGIDGHEQARQTHSLNDPRGGRRLEINVQIEMAHVEKRGGKHG